MRGHKSGIHFFSVRKKFILAFVLVQLVPIFFTPAVCQAQTAFNADDVFEIPSNNCSVRFTSDGTYSNAFLEDNTWFFEDLFFDPDIFSEQKLNISVSGTGCDITIRPFFIFSRSSQEDEVMRLFFRYSVEGHGTQSFNLGFDSQQGQIEAILDGEWIGLNHGWTRSSDGTVTVTAPVENVTISFYGFPQSYLEEPDLLDDHYIVIGSTFSLAVIVGLATIFAHNKRKGETN